MAGDGERETEEWREGRSDRRGAKETKRRDELERLRCVFSP